MAEAGKKLAQAKNYNGKILQFEISLLTCTVRKYEFMSIFLLQENWGDCEKSFVQNIRHYTIFLQSAIVDDKCTFAFLILKKILKMLKCGTKQMSAFILFLMQTFVRNFWIPFNSDNFNISLFCREVLWISCVRALTHNAKLGQPEMIDKAHCSTLWRIFGIFFDFFDHKGSIWLMDVAWFARNGIEELVLKFGLLKVQDLLIYIL